MSHRNSNNSNNRSKGQRGDNSNHPNGFERSKYRQTMPTNSRYNPISPQNHNNRFQWHNKAVSPTQSHVSTATNYNQPWSSPKFPTNGTPRKARDRFRSQDEPRMRTASVSNREEEKKSDRPRINFVDITSNFTKKIAGKFKKSDSKKQLESVRMSAPVIKLAETSTSSSEIPAATAGSSLHSPQKRARLLSARMQPDDRMKMFQRMGREQMMTPAQRMQKERQRDFHLVPGPGRACLEANLKSSNQSIESVLVYNNSSKVPDSSSFSMTEDDVEPAFKKSLFKTNSNSSQISSVRSNPTPVQKLAGGPSFTSTPCPNDAPIKSPAISNVRSISESSFCMVTPEPTTSIPQAAENSLYFSALGLCGPGSGVNTMGSAADVTGNTTKPLGDITIASTSSHPTNSTTPPTHSFNPVNVKQEPLDTESTSSHCPSVSTTPSEQQLAISVPSSFTQPEHLNTLWMVSKEIRERQLEINNSFPLLQKYNSRCANLEMEKTNLLVAKGDTPSVEDMRRMWSIERELQQVIVLINNTGAIIQRAKQYLPILESRRDELLALSPPPAMSQIPASFV